METKLILNANLKQMNNSYPQKRVALSELSHIGDNFYRIDKQELPFSDEAIKQLDSLVGISPQQKDVVLFNSGKAGLSNFRNYLTIATNAHKPQEVIMMANTETKMVEKVIPLISDFISYDDFMAFTNFFMDELRYEIVNVEVLRDETEATIYLTPLEPTITKITDGEEFITNGIFLHWSVSTIEIGRFYTRLVCINGATEQIKSHSAKIHSLTFSDIDLLLKTAKNILLQKKMFDGYRDKVLDATKGQASLAESRFCSQVLLQNGISEDVCEQLLASKEEEEICFQRGYESNFFRKVISRHKIWDLYNILTRVASHDTDFLQNDGRRRNIYIGADKLLSKKRDIINYLCLT